MKQKLKLGAIISALLLVGIPAPIVLADTGFPSGSISATYNPSTGVLSASGTYSGAPVSATKQVGFALFIDGATPFTPGSGSLDGVNTNTLHLLPLPTTATGAWSDSSHVLASAPSSVCVVIYDVHTGDIGSSGGHNNIPAGSDRNKDNSFEKNGGSYPTGSCGAPIILGSITVHKDVVKPDGVTDVSDSHGFTVKINAADPKPVSEGSNAVYDGLVPGTYTITEDLDSDYDLVSILPDTDGSTSGAQVVVSSGSNTDVYVVNKQEKATLTITKDVLDSNGDPVADNHSFSITLSDGQTGSVSENSPKEFDVDPGTISVVETADLNYDLVSYSPVSVTVGSNSSGSILITNKQKPAPVLSSLVCETKIYRKKSGNKVKSLHLETTNTDLGLNALWTLLWGVLPGGGPALTMLANHILVWPDGLLTMGGSIKGKLTASGPNKRLVLKKSGSLTTFVSGTGGMNPQLDAGGWHQVKIKNLKNVTVTFGAGTITGTLADLKVKLKKDSLTVADFELEVIGSTVFPLSSDFTVTGSTVSAPKTMFTALAGGLYNEEIKGKPKATGGHIEAESSKYSPTLASVSDLNDGNNDMLEERHGYCEVSP